jgi:Protein of unknown function (DUF4242)
MVRRADARGGPAGHLAKIRSQVRDLPDANRPHPRDAAHDGAQKTTRTAPPVRGWVSGQPDRRLFMVEHDLRGLSPRQRASAHQSLGEAVRRAVQRGSRIRYVQRILVQEESRCLCLFEAAGSDLVRNVNNIAQFPLARVVAVTSSPPPGNGQMADLEEGQFR